MKTCTQCNQLKPESDFSWRVKTKRTLQSRCKSCIAGNSKNWYTTNRTKHTSATRGNTQKYIERNRQYIKSLDLKCTVCGENHPATLDFHHIDPEQKDGTVSWLVHRGHALEKIQEEISKCVVMCSNCHRIHHWNEKKFDGDCHD